MGRGGKRAGAGRKRILSDEQMIIVAGACEERLNELWEHARDHAFRSRPGYGKLRSAGSRIRQLISKNPHNWEKTDEVHRLQETVQDAIKSMRNTPSWVTRSNPLFPRTAPRPYRRKHEIIAAISEEYSEKWGLTLTTRMVKRCWDEARKYRKEIAEEESEDEV